MTTKTTDEKKPPAGVADGDMSVDVRRAAYEARIAKEQAKCEPLFEQMKFFMALDAPSVNSASQWSQTLRSGSEEIQHQTVQLFPHRERLWVLGLAELPDLEAQTVAIDLFESFGLAWRILLWGIRQSIRERSTADH